MRTRSLQRTHWLLIGGAVAMVILVAGALLIVPRILHAQRVAQYQDTMEHVFEARNEAQLLRTETDQVWLLYALQVEEARDLHATLETLAGYSDHYFSTENLEDLNHAAQGLKEAITEVGLQPHPHRLVAHAQHHSMTHAISWPAHPFNLTPKEVSELLPLRQSEEVTPIPDAEVTVEVLDDAHAMLTQATIELETATLAFQDAQQLQSSLVTATAATLEPLAASAILAPKQAEVVLGMYPGAAEEVVEQLRSSAATAHDTVSAKLLSTEGGSVPIPVSDDSVGEVNTHAASEAWRAQVIAAHLVTYSEAITSAWITDAGSVEEALGFNPYLPFF